MQNNSNSTAGELIRDKYNVKKVFVSIFLKNSSSPKKFTINTKLRQSMRQIQKL